AAPDAVACRKALDRLIEVAPADFDLRAWAISAGGQAPTEKSAAGSVDPKAETAQFRKVLDAWASGHEDERLASLDALAGVAGTAFDLASWSRQIRGTAYPITEAELQSLLKAGHFMDIVDALIERQPTKVVASAAARDAGLREYCKKQAEECHDFGRK